MKRRVIIAGSFLILAAGLVFAFNPSRSAIAELAGGSDESCITRVRSEDDLRNLEKEALAKLEKAGLSPEDARAAFDPGFFAAEEVVSCPER